MRGSFSIEASIVLISVFAVFTSFTAYIRTVRAESIIRSALDMTAVEISTLCYPASRICEEISAAGKEGYDGEEKSGFLKYAGEIASAVGTGADIPSAEGLIGEVRERIGSLRDGGGSFQGISGDLSSMSGDSDGNVLSVIAGAVLSDVSMDLAGRLIAAPLCRILIPKYIAGDDSDRLLEQLGVKGGLDGLDFSLSCVLFNGSDITVAAVYEIEPVGVFPLFPSRKIVCRAQTAAWVPDSLLDRPDGSIWKLDSYRRGKAIVRLIKSERPGEAVKGGHGFSLYDKSGGVYTNVSSINPFSAYYSDYSGKEDAVTDPSEYTLKTASLAKEIGSRAASFSKSFAKLKNGTSLELENGGSVAAEKSGARLEMIIVFPEEAGVYADEIKRIADAAGAKRGIRISALYIQRALFSDEKKE